MTGDHSETMRHHTEAREVATGARFVVADLTAEVEAILAASGIRHGHITVFTREPGCALVVNEKESGLIADLEGVAGRIHDGAALPLGSTSVMLPAIDGSVAVGTWQRVLLVELDSQPSRTVVVEIAGD